MIPNYLISCECHFLSTKVIIFIEHIPICLSDKIVLPPLNFLKTMSDKNYEIIYLKVLT